MNLLDIQKLQFSDKARAESQMLALLKRNEDQSIARVELTPKPESLNSINGFITYEDGERCFFKTHVEENEQVSEYYNASSLQKAGYPMISAKQITHRPGKQISLYEIVSLPTLFDLLKEEEDLQLGGTEESPRARLLLQAQKNLDEHVFSIYEKTLQSIFAEQHAAAPIHQLFYHRLAENGRYGLYYKNKSFDSGKGLIRFEEIAGMRWRINGVLYKDSIADIVSRSQFMLAATEGPAVIGHGDAHNGNIFVNPDSNTLHMFDPAFAGLHNPLLDLTKPLFHNVFARWMYYPEQVSREIKLSFSIGKEEISVEHDFYPSRLRLAHLDSRKTSVLAPTLHELKKQALLADSWREYLHCSLFCCPFLTVNLFAEYDQQGALAQRYPLPIKILGLATAVAFGSLSHQGSDRFSNLIDGLFCE